MQNLTTPNEIAEYVNSTFQVPRTNMVLFGFDEIEPRDTRDFFLLYKMMVMTYSCIYAKWLNIGRNCYNVTGGKHAQNVFEILKLVYKVYPFDLDILVYTITESRRDVKEYGEQSFFYEFFNLEIDCKYSKLYDIIRTSFEGQSSKPKDIVEHFALLVQDLKVLHTLKITSIERSNGTKGVQLEFGNKQYDTFDLFTYHNNALHVLVNRLSLTDGLERKYQSLENSDTVSIISKI